MRTEKAEFVEWLKEKMKILAIEIIHWCQTLPKNDITNIVNRQVIRSATSVAEIGRAHV